MNKFTRELNFLNEFQIFIEDSNKGKRRSKNGSKILPLSIKKLQVTYNKLKDFSEQKAFGLRINVNPKPNNAFLQKEKKYWNKFHAKFTNYLYEDMNCFDNYVGSVTKDIRTFFNYLLLEKNMPVGNYHKNFFVAHESINILVLEPERLNFLINNKAFEEKLRPTLRKVKDIFIAGCTVGLRYSDLINLRPFNLEIKDHSYYLKVQSLKTKVYTRIKLPEYLVEIFHKYKGRNKTLLPFFNLVRLNIYLKELAECANWTEEVIKTRQKKGRSEIVYRNRKQKNYHRFCDLISSHTMRRSAITTMLRLRMPEHLVRKISGHAPNSKEFHKYVAISQDYLDVESDKVFEKLKALDNN